MKRALLALLMVPLLAGCGAQMRTLPVGEHRAQVSASLGGPMVKALGGTVPVPYGMAGATYGVSNHLEVYGDLHVTAAVFKFVGFTPGVTYFPFPDSKWVPSVGADALMFSDFSENRIYPEFTLALAHRTDTRWSPYVGWHSTLQNHRAPHYIPTVFLGTGYRRGRVNYYAELDWIAFTQNNISGPVDYSAAGTHGALAPQIGFSLDLDRTK